MNVHSFAESASLLVGQLIAVVFLLAAPSKSNEPASVEKPATDSMLGEEAGDVRDDNGLKMQFVWCPPGVVTMESVNNWSRLIPAELEKITPVTGFVTHGYWIGKYEVTRSEWKQVMESEPWKGPNDKNAGADFPATWVSWEDAMEFCRQLTGQERKSGRLLDGWEYTLPTEAQWERACRARTETRFCFGDDPSPLGDYAWFRENTVAAGEDYSHRVGRKKPNAWGLCDMHGNVWEICRDYCAERPSGGRDPEMTAPEKFRVTRGGFWGHEARYCSSGMRGQIGPAVCVPYQGFRVAL